MAKWYHVAICDDANSRIVWEKFRTKAAAVKLATSLDSFVEIYRDNRLIEIYRRGKLSRRVG